MWDKEKLLEAAQSQVNPKRFTHILGVVETATRLANTIGVDPNIAEVAAILHDYCKAWTPERLKETILAYNDTNWLSYPTPTWHAPAAYYTIQEEFGIMDHDLLNAIYYHTTGRAKMSPLEKVIWVADYIEPNRNFPGVEQARDLVKIGIDDALRFGLKETIRHLTEQEQLIHPLTLDAYNYYLNRR